MGYEMKTGIYMIQNKINKKVYVGSAVNIQDRWRVHKSDLRKNRHHSILLQRAWNKWGEENFEFIILEPVKDPLHLLAVEQTFLDYYKCYEPEKGYNICPTAGSHLGMKRSEEARKKMSEARKGKTFSEETKKKMSEAQKLIYNEETKNRLELGRRKNKGKALLKEHREKIGCSKRGKGKGYSIDKDGKYIASIRINGKYKYLGYYNTEEAARAAYLQALNNE